MLFALLLALPPALAPMLAPGTVPHAQAAVRHLHPAAVSDGVDGSLLRCTTVSLTPRQAGTRAGRLANPDRFFAPTRQAIFFSRPGTRCAWSKHASKG